MDSKLKELALKANQDEWFSGYDEEKDDAFVYTKLPLEKAGPNAIHVLFNSDWGTEEDAAYIAAANPAAVLNLITRLEKAEELLGGCVIQSDCDGECGDPANCAHAEAKAFLEAER